MKRILTNEDALPQPVHRKWLLVGLLAMLFRGDVERLVDLCLVVVTILISVPSSPNASRPTSPMPRNLIIVDTDVVFPLPNSRLYHKQRNANIPVSPATTLMCSSSWSMKDLMRPLIWQPCLHMHCFLPTAFALYMYANHFHC